MVEMHLQPPIQNLLNLQPSDDVALFLKACATSLSNPTEQRRITIEVVVRFCQTLTTEYTSVAMDNVQWHFKTLALENLVKLNQGKGL